MLIIYKCSVSNVRELKKQRCNLKRLFNKCICHNDKPSFDTLTKLYALLYSSFAETCFLKMLHTPYGFSDELINQVLSQRNLEQQRIKCLELAFQGIDSEANKRDIQNKKQILTKHIQTYIIQPSEIRNKIAHGQWKVALNSKNSNKNDETTGKIADLDFVKIDILFELYEKTAQVLEDLIESPQKTHFRDFYLHITKLEELIEKTKEWTFESKIKKIRGKKEK